MTTATSILCPQGPAGSPTGRRRAAFSLTELMVVIVIIALLSSLTLAGLAGVRQRAKIDKTKSTIRKIHEIIVPQYESFMRRRLPALTGTPTKRERAEDRLLKIRTLQMREMPDTWADVYADLATVNGLTGGNAYLKTAPVRAYAQRKSSLTAAGLLADPLFSLDTSHGSAECLYMIVAHGPEPDALEAFRNDEIADTDGDGAAEFIDAWGTPIAFLRWAPGYSDPPLSFVQSKTIISNVAANPDPFDPFQVDTGVADGYALVPLIVSAGRDTSFGLNVATRQTDGWSDAEIDLKKLIEDDRSTTGLTAGTGQPNSSGDHADNISNHTFAAD